MLRNKKNHIFKRDVTKKCKVLNNIAKYIMKIQILKKCWISEKRNLINFDLTIETLKIAANTDGINHIICELSALY